MQELRNGPKLQGHYLFIDTVLPAGWGMHRRVVRELEQGASSSLQLQAVLKRFLDDHLDERSQGPQTSPLD